MRLRRALKGLLGGIGVGALLAGCTDTIPRRSCSKEIWARPSSDGAQVSVIGSWDGWLAPGRALVSVGDGGWYRRVIDDLPAGEYGYLIYEDGKGRVDPYNPLTTFWEAHSLEVSLLKVESCAAPAIEVHEIEAFVSGDVRVSGRFLASEAGAAIDPLSVRVTSAGSVGATVIDRDSGSITADLTGLPRGRHELVIAADDAEGRTATARAVAWVQPAARRWEEGVIYHVMIDRFRGDDGAWLAPPASPGGRAGGTLSGLLAAIEDGSLARLGVTALWLSPAYLGPMEARLGRGDGHLYESYHGYWPLESRTVEPRIGGEEGLRALVEGAHARGLRVILDVVPNHIYEDHPRVAEGWPQGWFNAREPLCVCGDPGCDWGQFIETCWFTNYLPDLRFQVGAVMEAAVADTLWWIERFNLDGVRIDAVPMMPRAVTRRLVHEVRARAWPPGPEAALLLGEIFTGPGAAGIDAYRYFMGPDGLDSAFDFPLMWALRDVIARGRGFEEVESILTLTEARLAGSGALLGLIIGNHDTTRFISEVAGDADADPWASPPPQPTETEIYERHFLALGLMYTLPGAPVLYYGDEVGLAGASDPDCRRVMPSDASLSPPQVALRAKVEALAALRRCARALQVGERRPLVAEGGSFAFVRDAGAGEVAVVVVSASDSASSVSLPFADLSAGEFVDGLTGEIFLVGSGVPMPPRSLRVLLPRSSPCAE
jgi:glycosidase